MDSMITVRRAIGDLVARGLQARQRGRGTFVARGRVCSRVAQAGPPLRAGIGDGHLDLSSRVIRFERVGYPPCAARFLGLAPGLSCWEIVRVHTTHVAS